MSSPPLPSAASTRALSPGTRLAEYEIERVLAEAGEGFLYVAHDHGLQRRVALREYLPSVLARRGRNGEAALLSAEAGELFSLGLRGFAHEARLLARCDHPALAKVLRYWETRHTGYMVMRWHDGEPLHVRRHAMPRPPGEAELRALLVELLGALEALHASFAQHREITPRNILLQPDARPVLLGFHAARRVLSERGVLTAGRADSAYAPLEMHPEGSHLQQGPWSDLYSLAAVAYFCLAGGPPPSASERLEAGSSRFLGAAADAACSRHPGLQYSPGFLTALDWGFELQPQDRPRSAAQWRAILQQTMPPTRGRGVPGRAQAQGKDASPERLASAAVLKMRPPEPGPLHDTASQASQEPSAPLPSSAQAAPERSPPDVPRRAPAPSHGFREPGWGADAESGAPAEEPSEVAVRAALAAALGSLPPPDGRLAVDRRAAAAPPVHPPPGLPSRRWLWPAIGVLGLMALAAGWQGKQQHEAQELSRALAGTVALPREVVSPVGEAQPGLPSGAQPPAGAGVASLAEAVPPAPPPQADVLATSSAEAAERDAQGMEEMPSATMAPPETTPPQAAAPRAKLAALAEASPAVTGGGMPPPPVDAPRLAAAPAPPARVEFRSPREACAPRQRFSLYYCMQQQCEKPKFHSHRQCRVLRERDEIE